MAYQYRGPKTTTGARPPVKPKHNWTNKLTRISRRRDKMLDKGRENYFKYDMEDLLKRGNVPEERRLSLAATIFAKGSRDSTQAAKDYAQEKFDEGLMDEATFRGVMNLIDGYSIWR